MKNELTTKPAANSQIADIVLLVEAETQSPFITLSKISKANLGYLENKSFTLL